MTSKLMDHLLESRAVQTRFQPVVKMLPSSERRLHLREALTAGSQQSNLASPGVVLEYARRNGKEGPLDRLCAATAIRTFSALSLGETLSLNLHASTLQSDHGFLDFLRETASDCNSPLSQAVVEVLEHAPYWAKTVSVRRWTN